MRATRALEQKWNSRCKTDTSTRGGACVQKEEKQVQRPLSFSRVLREARATKAKAMQKGSTSTSDKKEEKSYGFGYVEKVKGEK